MNEHPLLFALTPARPGRIPCPWTWGRISLLLIFMALWGALILFRLGQLMLFPREKLVRAVQQDSWVAGEVPAPRGCILDRDGRPLAWSTRHFALYWQVPADAVLAREEFAVLRQYVRPESGVTEERVAAAAGTRLLVRLDLSARELDGAGRLRGSLAGLELRGYSVRHRTADPALAAIVGTVRLESGREIGESGLEKEQDEKLNGTSGQFRVMVGRDGKWIRESWQKTAEIRPGYDVYLPIRPGQPMVASAAPATRH